MPQWLTFTLIGIFILCALWGAYEASIFVGIIFTLLFLFIFWVPLVKAVAIFALFLSGDNGIWQQFRGWLKSLFSR